METGLDYRGARFYDSDVARFLSLDPLAAEYPLLSDYCYVAANPLLFVDKDGRQVEPAFKNETDKKKYETVMSQVSQSTEFNIMFNQIDIKEEVYKIRMMTSSEKAKYDPRGRAAYNPKSNELIFRANSDIHEAAIIEEIAHAGQRYPPTEPHIVRPKNPIYLCINQKRRTYAKKRTNKSNECVV